MRKSFEVNFDGLVGPTHHYGGLSFGNTASTKHKAFVSNPREAALQGLSKMKALAELGFKQALLPPQLRPHLPVLRSLGFSGSASQILEAAYKASPEMLSACASSSYMWTANAATVAPSADTEDGKVHFTPANLVSKFHRALEADATGINLKSIFQDESYFVHHPALPSVQAFGDEGAANHTRFCRDYGEPGVQFFVFGRSSFEASRFKEPTRFPARQALEASKAIARLHKLNPDRVVFAHQSPEVIDRGAFHNDVVAVGNRNVLFFHEKAFTEKEKVLSELQQKIEKTCETRFIPVEVRSEQVSLEEAVKSYLFNSQLVSLPSGDMALISPSDCEESPSVFRYLSALIESKSTPIREVRYFNLRQSMSNGGGPACLRLRVVLTEQEMAHCKSAVFVTPKKYDELCSFVRRFYRDRLTIDDLRDPMLWQECHAALEALSSIVGFELANSAQTGCDI